MVITDSYASESHNSTGAVLIGYETEKDWGINISTYGISNEQSNRLQELLGELLSLPAGTTIRFHRNGKLESILKLY